MSNGLQGIAPGHVRCTVAFVGPAGEVLGSEWIEVEEARLADPEFVRWNEADQLRRRCRTLVVGTTAVLLVGQLSDAQACIELSRRRKPNQET